MNKFEVIKFKDCNLNDPFFNSLKNDYKDFIKWFQSKAEQGKEALVYFDGNDIKAFINLKYNETEEIDITDKTLPNETRMKISTLKLSDDIQGQRLGEGSIGYCLWEWQKNKNTNQIYVTVYDKHKSLILLLNKFGFIKIGTKDNGENVYIKDKRNIDKSDAYKAFPYIVNSNCFSRLIPVNQEYHDTLFTYSELGNTNQEADEIAAANGITKIYIATPFSQINYDPGTLTFIFRKHTGNGKPAYKSVITSYCTIVKQIYIRQNWKDIYSFADFIKLVGNKSVYTDEQLNKKYNNSKSRNIVLLEMVYNGYMGKGHNVTWAELKNNNLWGNDIYPYDLTFNNLQSNKIFELGDKNVQDIIIN